MIRITQGRGLRLWPDATTSGVAPAPTQRQFQRSFSMTGTAGVNVRTTSGSQLRKWPKIAAVWQDPSDFASVAAAAQLDHINLHIATGSNAAALKATNPNIILSMYGSVLTSLWNTNIGTNPWANDFNAAASEDWFLHSPQTTLTSAARINRAGDVVGQIGWQVDPRTTAAGDWLGDAVMRFMKGQYGGFSQLPAGSRFFIDGSWPNSSLSAYAKFGSSWRQTFPGWLSPYPTLSAHQGWGGSSTGGTDPAWLITFYDRIRPKLRAAGYELESNSMWGNIYTGDNLGMQESFLIPHCTATWLESYFDQDNTLRTSGVDLQGVSVPNPDSVWVWQLRRLSSSMAQNKDWIGIAGGIADSNGLTLTVGVPKSKWVACIVGVLMYTNGVNGYIALYDAGFGHHGSLGDADVGGSYWNFLIGVQSKIAGPNTNDGHNGAAFSGDGSVWLTRRNFLRSGGGADVIVLLNIDPNGVSRTDAGSGVSVPAGTGWIDGQTTF